MGLFCISVYYLYSQLKHVIMRFSISSIGCICIFLFLTSCSRDLFDSDQSKSTLGFVSVSRSLEAYGCDFSQVIGGGEGYTQVFSEANADIVISSSDFEDFKDTVESASNGSIIYIPDNITITIKESIELPESVWLVSNRGESLSEGAVLKLDNSDKRIIKAFKNNRISGLSFDGNGVKNGVGIYGLNVEVDNCKMYSFGNAAVSVERRENHIHHNWILNNQSNQNENGTGYGVIINENDFAKIESNLFELNRHDVSGNGRGTCGYEAFNNHIKQSGNNTAFDMHDWGNSPYVDVPNEHLRAAGGFIHVHHNTFEQANRARVSVRGVPQDGCFVHNNHFKNSSERLLQNESLVYQRNYIGSMYSFNNKYEFGKYNWKVFWSGKGSSENLDFGNINFNDLTVADFDGDLKSDIFIKASIKNTLAQYTNQWLVTNTDKSFMEYMPSAAAERSSLSSWEYLLASNVPVGQLLFGQFNNNNKTDVIRVAGGSIRAIFDGLGSWKSINSTNVPIDQLRLGFFDDNPLTDIIRFSNGKITVLYDGRGQWKQLNTTNVPLSQLKFGDFDGNGLTDIVRIAGGKIRMLKDGRGGWINLNSTDYSISDLDVGDFDGDGRSDIIRFSGSKLYVLKSGQGNWVLWNNHYVPSLSNSKNILGDFNGDGETDILVLSEDYIL